MNECRTKVSVQVRSFICKSFLTRYVFTVRSCQHLAQPPNWRTSPCRRPRLLIQYIRGYPPYWTPFLHPQPEETPCRGDRDPLIMGKTVILFTIISKSLGPYSKSLLVQWMVTSHGTSDNLQSDITQHTFPLTTQTTQQC